MNPWIETSSQLQLVSKRGNRAGGEAGEGGSVSVGCGVPPIGLP